MNNAVLVNVFLKRKRKIRYVAVKSLKLPSKCCESNRLTDNMDKERERKRFSYENLSD